MSETSSGFLVWNPARGMPTVSHPTLQKAVAEAERLKGAYPGEAFFIMSPVDTTRDIALSVAWAEGKEAGVKEGYDRVEIADRARERALDIVGDLNSKARRFEAIDVRHRAFQAIVADCLLWFDGFSAAHAGKEAYEQPRIPDRDTLRLLNGALQALEDGAPPYDLDDGIPF